MAVTKHTLSANGPLPADRTASAEGTAPAERAPPADGTTLSNRLPPEVCQEVLRTCGCHNLRRATRSVTQLYDEVLAPSGLRATQVVLLVLLAAEGEMTMSALARQLVLSPSTLSRNLKPLQRDGLVELRALPSRGKAVQLTEHGHQQLVDVAPLWIRAQEKFTGLVGASSWEDLSERLGRAVSAVRQ